MNPIPTAHSIICSRMLCPFCVVTSKITLLRATDVTSFKAPVERPRRAGRGFVVPCAECIISGENTRVKDFAAGLGRDARQFMLETGTAMCCNGHDARRRGLTFGVCGERLSGPEPAGLLPIGWNLASRGWPAFRQAVRRGGMEPFPLPVYGQFDGA